jgi:hypothetical protein
MTPGVLGFTARKIIALPLVDRQVPLIFLPKVGRGARG